ncbi:MAG: A/G-specific adenine glycosylase [Magnetococcales bacterium]|nr:A/G-specific adenine glycosylase [Magnetococcales bacterium]
MAGVGELDGVRMAGQLLGFYDRQGRQLPWRGERDLYRLWVSEIMLQQTGVATVLSYYPRFLARFPTVESLAGSTEEAVLLAWQGLGYYRRAQHLHRAAQRLVARGGGLPEELEGWLGLPGIGPSTAAAILAIGRDQPHAILDGNVKRVLARLLAFPHPLNSSRAQQVLWSVARQLTPRQRPGDYAQAIMDLGATLCTRSQPDCLRCPWQEHCQAHRLAAVASFPVVVPRPGKPRRRGVAALIFDKNRQLLLCQRPAQGLLAGLWEPPTLAMDDAEMLPLEPQSVAQRIAQRFNLHTTLPQPLPPVQHTFTHFHLTLYPFVCQWLGEEGEGVGNEAGYQTVRWLPRAAWHTLPCATLHRKILRLLEPPTASPENH